MTIDEVVDLFKNLWDDCTEVLKMEDEGKFVTPRDMANELGLRMHGVFEMAEIAGLPVPMETEDKWGTYR